MLFLLIATKGALVLLAGVAAVRVLRGAPASARHAVWTATFCALLLVPMLSIAGPVWHVAAFPASPASSLPLAGVAAEPVVLPTHTLRREP